MRIITATELKNNLGKYLELMQKEEIVIYKRGKYIGSMKGPKIEQLDVFFDKYTGIFKEDDNDLNDPRIAKIIGKLWDF